ncbi:methyltransferase domain-containing protein [Diaporthe amygdali]|uniref:methyltransferase domain-containing protein n=1 Tax=Phomopsis amygdali TaxID=1214568 RepID=UPI0022FEB9C0|nr:methyltransferase domain-containing protein [Diaporthe amygdali]KAJ0117353.1 methyltransferase domain-containing protein [Diaporthe amygdali]
MDIRDLLIDPPPDMVANQDGTAAAARPQEAAGHHAAEATADQSSAAAEIRAALGSAPTPHDGDAPTHAPEDGKQAAHPDSSKDISQSYEDELTYHDSAAVASGSGPGSSSGAPGSSTHPDSDNASLNAPSSFSVGLSIDTDDSDADSALGSVRAQSSSMSASSSIFDFVEEHGRTWHRYHEGKYFMPNDIPEQERLELQHSISVRLFGGLSLAPIERPNRVLDIGTGTGIWAIEFANEHPESDVLGTDLSPIQPEYVPPNCRFEVDDAEDEWVFNHRFDYIHARFMCGSFGNFPEIFRSCLENLEPGGWAEFQDYYVKLQCMDESLVGTALERWNDCVLEGVRRMGKNGLAAARFKAQMLDAGFVDVVERKFALPGNPWAKGEDQKMLGMMQMENILDGLHGFSIGLFTKMLGMAAEEVELMLMDVRKDLRNTKIHFYYIV